MAAYAALVSLTHIIEQIERHPRPPLSLDRDQVESLTEKVSFLQEFLEGYSHVAGYSNEADTLESRIADAAHAAEDVIESRIVDHILAGSTSHGERISSIEFYQGLQKVIEVMDMIKNEVMEIKEKMRIQDQLHINSSGFSSTWQNSTTIVGFDDYLNGVMDILTNGQPDRLVLSIVGMGGIGKTALARKISKNQVVVQHFDILVWVTISQEYGMREIFLQLLQEDGGGFSQNDNYELGDKLHKRLSGRRYLIIMDDIWDIELWDKLKLFFPDNSNGSRIMLTTRLYRLVSQLHYAYCIELDFLDEDDSWDLFCQCVFGEEDCPSELEEIGEKIVQNCQGLPMSIVVIGGLLAKSEQTPQFWEYIAENLNSLVNVEDNERCLQILYTSYNNLPVYLKPCFLYMGVFPEDCEIHASELIKLWAAEGFLKPIADKSLEEVAEEYLGQLFDRSLILVEEYNSLEKLKVCRMHDLLRDLCLREARKQKFLCVLGVHGRNIPQELNTERRICMNHRQSKKEYLPPILDALESASPAARCLIWESEEPNCLPSFSFRLLRVCSVVNHYVNGEEHYLESVLQQVNLRYLCLDVTLDPVSSFPSSVSRLWNLETLIVSSASVLSAPLEIWKMPLLRHVIFTDLELPDPPMDGPADIVLENLKTLSRVQNFKCCAEVVKRIPNVNKLKVSYDAEEIESCLNNLGQLDKLESLGLGVHSWFDAEDVRSHLVRSLILPHSLKKLTLDCTFLHWEDLTSKIGSLPLLEVLKLRFDALIGPEWETVEGQFCSLIVLVIESCDMEYWTTDGAHFPRLELLFLQGLKKLKEIPLSVGDIPTLELIELGGCSAAVVDSAKRIQEEQEKLGNEDLVVC